MIIHRTIMATIVITMTNITMTSIAIMTIFTAIPMLMTTSKAPARPRRRAVVRTGAIKQVPAQLTGGQNGMTESEAAALYRLMTWLSPAFPVGAFSYSSGIEWAVEAGDIKDAATLQAWLTVMLRDGSGFCDAVLFAHAHRAAGQAGRQGRLVPELDPWLAPRRGVVDAIDRLQHLADVCARIHDVVPGTHPTQTLPREQPRAEQQGAEQVDQKEEEGDPGAEGGHDQHGTDEDEAQLPCEAAHLTGPAYPAPTPDVEP